MAPDSHIPEERGLEERRPKWVSPRIRNGYNKRGTAVQIPHHEEVMAMTDASQKGPRSPFSKGLKYHGEELKEVVTTSADDRWQFVRIGTQDYPRKCVRIEGDDVLVSVACLESEGEEGSRRVDVEFVNAKMEECRFLYVVDSAGQPIEWKIKR